MKSKRKHTGHLNKEIHEKLKGLLFYASPGEVPWRDSDEVANVIKKTFGIDIPAQKLGAYLTASLFIKKDFYETRSSVKDDPTYDGDYPSRKVKKWRVGIYDADAPEPAGDISEMGLTWDEVRKEDVDMYKVILGIHEQRGFDRWEKEYKKERGGWTGALRRETFIGDEIDAGAVE